VVKKLSPVEKASPGLQTVFHHMPFHSSCPRKRNYGSSQGVLSIRRQNLSGVQSWKNTNYRESPARRLERRGFFQQKAA